MIRRRRFAAPAECLSVRRCCTSWPPKKLLCTPKKVGRREGEKARRVKVVWLKGGNFRLRTL